MKAYLFLPPFSQLQNICLYEFHLIMINICNHFLLPIDLPCIKAHTDYNFCCDGVSLLLSLFGINPQMNGFHHETAGFLHV